MMFGENAGLKLTYYLIFNKKQILNGRGIDCFGFVSLVAGADIHIHGWASPREMSCWFAATLHNTGDWINIIRDENDRRSSTMSPNVVSYLDSLIWILYLVIRSELGCLRPWYPHWQETLANAKALGLN